MLPTAARVAEAQVLSAPEEAARGTARRVLLACGGLSVLTYVGWHEIAALQWPGYSRVSNAISELHLAEAPSKWVLDPWEGITYAGLLLAFGVGVWMSAKNRRSLQALAAFQVLPAVMFPLWVVFGDDLVVHTILGFASMASWVGSMVVIAVAFRGPFRIYSLVSLVLVVGFFIPVFAYAPAVDAGDPTPYIGLFERLAFSTYFLWLLVLVVTLWPRRAAVRHEALATGNKGE